jgi:hypothetical protein
MVSSGEEVPSGSGLLWLLTWLPAATNVRQVADLGMGNQMSLEELQARLAAAKQRQLEEVSPACKPARATCKGHLQGHITILSPSLRT